MQNKRYSLSIRATTTVYQTDQERRNGSALVLLKVISTGDFSEALAALLWKDAKGLSAGTISRLKQCWVNEYDD
jgi:hypothetical protein